MEVALLQQGWSQKVSEEKTWAETKRGQPWLKRGESLLYRTAITMTRRQESRRHFCRIFWKEHGQDLETEHMLGVET